MSHSKMAQQLAIEEEKKRKRAAKFGTGAAATKGAATDSVRLFYSLANIPLDIYISSLRLLLVYVVTVSDDTAGRQESESVGSLLSLIHVYMSLQFWA